MDECHVGLEFSNTEKSSNVSLEVESVIPCRSVFESKVGSRVQRKGLRSPFTVRRFALPLVYS